VEKLASRYVENNLEPALRLFYYEEKMCDPDYIEEPEQRKCHHCETCEEDGDMIREAHCEGGFGLLHCESCSEECDICGELYCKGLLEDFDGGETYGDIVICKNCKEDLEI
jgi:hypothetical protein